MKLPGRVYCTVELKVLGTGGDKAAGYCSYRIVQVQDTAGTLYCRYRILQVQDTAGTLYCRYRILLDQDTMGREFCGCSILGHCRYSQVLGHC